MELIKQAPFKKPTFHPYTCITHHIPLNWKQNKGFTCPKCQKVVQTYIHTYFIDKEAYEHVIKVLYAS